MSVLRSKAGGRRAALYALMLLAALAGAPARANDSTAVLAADGIRLMRTAAVEMVSEELRISPRRVRVRYVFRAPYDTERTIVAFPLPLLPFSEPESNVYVPGRHPARDPVDFRLRVDGRPVRPNVQARALLNGVDFTALLRRHGIGALDILDADVLESRLERLDPAARAELIEAGLAKRADVAPPEELPPGVHLPQWEAAWDVEVLYWWRQTFPKGREVVVEHAYAPIAGSFFFSFPVPAEVRREYCTEASFLAAARRKALRGRTELTGGEVLMAREVHYILRTAGNWAGDIGRFRLVIDKEKAGDLVSLCWRGLRRVSPTRFVFEARHFRPNRDLGVLFLSDLPQ